MKILENEINAGREARHREGHDETGKRLQVVGNEQGLATSKKGVAGLPGTLQCSPCTV